MNIFTKVYVLIHKRMSENISVDKISCGQMFGKNILSYEHRIIYRIRNTAINTERTPETFNGLIITLADCSGHQDNSKLNDCGLSSIEFGDVFIKGPQITSV